MLSKAGNSHLTIFATEVLVLRRCSVVSSPSIYIACKLSGSLHVIKPLPQKRFVEPKQPEVWRRDDFPIRLFFSEIQSSELLIGFIL